MPWDWIVLIVFLAGFGMLGFRYYRKQAVKFSHGERNKGMDKFRGGGSCCH